MSTIKISEGVEVEKETLKKLLEEHVEKEIIPYKLIITLDDDGEIARGVLQYRMKVDGILQPKFYSMAVKDGISSDIIKTALSESKAHVEKGEKIK